MGKLLFMALLFLGCAGPVHYVASKNSQVFHKSSCGEAHHIKGENLVQLGDDRAVAARDHKACEVCKP